MVQEIHRVHTIVRQEQQDRVQVVAAFPEVLQFVVLLPMLTLAQVRAAAITVHRAAAVIVLRSHLPVVPITVEVPQVVLHHRVAVPQEVTHQVIVEILTVQAVVEVLTVQAVAEALTVLPLLEVAVVEVEAAVPVAHAEDKMWLMNHRNNYSL